MPREDEGAGKPRSRENENLKPGAPPKPATNPPGSDSSTETDKTLSDPSTGSPNPHRPDTAAGG
jgi:hypothetical protein